MKHGPIALISEGMPAVFVATKSDNYDKIISNIEEVRARGGKTIVIANYGDEDIEGKEGGVSHRVPWGQGILKFFKLFF